MIDASRPASPLNAPGKTIIRAVLDTNVVIAAHLSRNPRSLTIELIDRWLAGEFVQLYSDDTLIELQEKFLERQIDPTSAEQYTANLFRFGEYVEVAPDQIQRVLTGDPDDDLILACAFVGSATHIVTYDPYFDLLGGRYHGIPILDGLHFLYVVRGDKPPEK